MKRALMVVVIPVGPMCVLKYVYDTIESIRHYCDISTEIVLVNDSGNDIDEYFGGKLSKIHILNTSKNNGKEAGLYYTLCQGFRYAYENFDFDVLLRLDTDALIIGEAPELDAIDYFLNDDTVGLIGSYKYNSMNEKRNYDWARRQLYYESSYLSFFYRKNSINRIRAYKNILKRALKNGYKYGEHCLGGAYFMKYECVKQLSNHDLLPMSGIENSRLQEDMIMGLLVSYVGFRMGDFSNDGQPMGLDWRGLPSSPKKLVDQRKKIIHSTRFFKSMNESEIRKHFMMIRKKNGDLLK